MTSSCVTGCDGGPSNDREVGIMGENVMYVLLCQVGSTRHITEFVCC